MFKAPQLLVKHGYQLDLKRELTEGLFNRLIQIDTKVQLRSERNGVTVDLQWDLAGRYFSVALDLARVKGRLVRFDLLKPEVLQFSREDLLVYLCIHGNRHCWAQLDAVCCVNGLIGARSGLDWRQFFNTAKQLCSKRMLLIRITPAHDLPGTALPEGVVEQLAANKKNKELTDQAVEKMFQGRGADAGSVVSGITGTPYLRPP